MKIKRSFASDNNSGVLPQVLKAIADANDGHFISYGDDPITAGAIQRFRDIFGEGVDVFFVFNGTAANVLGLRAAVDSFGAVLCAEHSHIEVDECNAPERFIGCKLVTIPTGRDGKLTVESLQKHCRAQGDVHHAQPQAVSITQATEYGTVYTVDEIRRIADFAHQRKMMLHMDGARVANAAQALGVGLRELTRDAGVDILSFGGTKNGLMGAEAVVIFNPLLSANFGFFRKQGMQLASKMRFLSAQFDALLTDDLWLRNAKQANQMAGLLAREVKRTTSIRITREVQANAVFATLPPEAISEAQKEYHFYVVDPESSEVRWMCSFDTTEKDVMDFVEVLRRALQG